MSARSRALRLALDPNRATSPQDAAATAAPAPAITEPTPRGPTVQEYTTLAKEHAALLRSAQKIEAHRDFLAGHIARFLAHLAATTADPAIREQARRMATNCGMRSPEELAQAMGQEPKVVSVLEVVTAGSVANVANLAAMKAKP